MRGKLVLQRLCPATIKMRCMRFSASGKTNCWPAARRPEAMALMIELMVGVSKRLADLVGLPLPGLSALISDLPLCVTLEEMNVLILSALADYQQVASRQVEREKETGSVRKALQYADKHFHQDVSIDEVAEHVGLSNSHFCVLFKRKRDIHSWNI